MESFILDVTALITGYGNLVGENAGIDNSSCFIAYERHWVGSLMWAVKCALNSGIHFKLIVFLK